MQGKIIKGIAGFYYIYAEDGFLYECKGRGILRQKKITPLVGDNVELSVVSKDDLTGNIEKILPRRNSLIRPAVANVDQALIVFAKTDPLPNMGLLDRLLAMMEKCDIECIIAFNKSDLENPSDIDLVREEEAYRQAGYEVHDICVRTGEGLDELKKLLRGKTTTLAGPSGVGKSSLVNLLIPDAKMETGEISEKLNRGKHTTRHAEIFVYDKDSFVFDTPGFTSFELRGFEAEELADYYPEFVPFVSGCKFSMCSHTHEPNCGVRAAVDEGKVSHLRYDRYKQMYEELKAVRKY